MRKRNLYERKTAEKAWLTINDKVYNITKPNCELEFVPKKYDRVRKTGKRSNENFRDAIMSTLG